jgi:hypothetical protein
MVLYYNVGTSATDGKKSPLFFAPHLQEGSKREVMGRHLLIRAEF